MLGKILNVLGKIPFPRCVPAEGGCLVGPGVRIGSFRAHASVSGFCQENKLRRFERD